MKTNWLNPCDIEEMWGLNSRRENTSHIESLTESMREHGYLPEYPLVVFKTDRFKISIGKEFVLACGHHRRKAAIAANLDIVCCEIHGGSEEDWIEKMSMDNFKFDASEPGVGLAFTASERKKACIHMLLLPKFLEQTNVALANLWKVGERTVANWRDEVETLIREHAETLQPRISEARIAKLNKILESHKRISSEGETVKVRQKPQELTHTDKQAIWKRIELNGIWGHRSDGRSFISRHKTDSFSIENAIAKLLDVERSDIPKNLTEKQLKQVENWILTEDETFVSMCHKVEQDRLQLRDARSTSYASAQDLIKAVFKHLFPADFSMGNETNYMRQRTHDVLSTLVQETYGIKLDSYNDADTVTEAKAYQEKIGEIIDDIAVGADVFLKLKEDFIDGLINERGELKRKWQTAHDALLKAKTEHLQGISNVLFSGAFFEQADTSFANLDDIGLPEKLEADIAMMQEITDDIIKEADWVKTLKNREAPPPSELNENHRITSIDISYEDENEHDFSFDFGDTYWADYSIEDIPSAVLGSLWKIVLEHHEGEIRRMKAEETE